MKRAMILFSSVLFVVLVVAPVMAIKPLVEEVTATQVGEFKPGTLTYTLNDGGVFFFAGELSGTVNLDITSTTVNPDYILDVSGAISGIINTKTDDGVIHIAMVWTHKNSVDEVDGAFEGVVEAKTTTYLYVAGIPHPYYSTNIYHTVLQGSGIFSGQTLRIDGIRPTYDPNVFPPQGPPNLLTWDGTLLTR